MLASAPLRRCDPQTASLCLDGCDHLVHGVCTSGHSCHIPLLTLCVWVFAGLRVLSVSPAAALFMDVENACICCTWGEAVTLNC